MAYEPFANMHGAPDSATSPVAEPPAGGCDDFPEEEEPDPLSGLLPIEPPQAGSKVEQRAA
jgi:hypothetical protein